MYHSKRKYWLANAVTIYRLAAAPLLLTFLLTHQYEVFKWLLVASFVTDAIDGPLARRYKVESVLGSRLDSIADDITIGVALTGAVMLRPGFFKNEIAIILLLGFLYLLQIILALTRYGRITSFHTYLAKVAAVFQSGFLILFFFFDKRIDLVFYLAVFVTTIDVIEEIILVLLLPEWQADVKGLYWLRKT